ncbi:sec1 family domain-containing protein 2 [Lampetra planeri]
MSAAGDLAPLALSGWRLVLSEARDAAVFVDAASAESLHWTGGAGGDAGPWRAGAAALRTFPGRKDDVQQQQQPTKVVFALSSPVLLGGRVAASLRDVLVSVGGVHHCVVFTSVSHAAHLDLLQQQQQQGGGGLGVSAAAAAVAAASSSAADSEPRPVLFELLEQHLRQWMSGGGSGGGGGADCTARVLHAAGIALCPLASGVVLAPASASLFPLVPSDLLHPGGLAGGRGSRRGVKQQPPQQQQKQQSLNDVDVSALPASYASSLRLLAWWLDSSLRHLGVREECFAVGPTSRLLAIELASLPPARARRKGATGRASLVLVDRTLDLAGAVGHHGDSLAERILGVLPRLPGVPSDVAVNMTALTALRRDGGVPPREVLAPGCLAQPSDVGAKALWEAMLYSKQKEAVMEVRRQVVERAGQAGHVLKMAMGKVTGEQLESYVCAFPRDAGGHAALLQLVLATAQTLEHPAGARRDALLASEKLLLQILKEGDFPRVLGQLRARIKPRDERKEGDLQPADILQLLLFVYSLIGSSAPGGRDQEREEAELQEALGQVLAEQGCLADTWRDFAGAGQDGGAATPSQAERERLAASVLEALRGVARARHALKRFSSIYDPGEGAHQPAAYRPLLKQILDEIFAAEQPDSSDIEHMASGLTDLLKTGISMFMKVSRPRPADHPLVVIFVVGGVTPAEIKLVRDSVTAMKVTQQVLVMSTRLLQPSDVPVLLFSKDRLNPTV